MNVVLVGHVCVDHNTSEQSSYTSWGSPLMYMAAYFRAHTNIDPVLIAPYGTDFQEYAKGLRLLSVPQGKSTLLYKNVTRSNHRTQWCGNVEAADPVAITNQVKSCVAEADIIVLAPLLPNYTVEYIKEILATKRPDGLTVLLPQGFLRAVGPEGGVSTRIFEEINEVLPLFDLAVLSHDDVRGDFREVQMWARENAKTDIIMTQGELGASWVTPSELVPVRTEPVAKEQIVDSVGCGDTFSAAAMISYFATGDVMAAIKAGNEAAGAKLRQDSRTGTLSHQQPVSRLLP